MLTSRVINVLSDAEPSALARTDQIAGLWRDFYATRELDLSKHEVGESAMRALTMIYGLLMAAHAAGEITDESWDVIAEVIAAGAAAVTVTRERENPGQQQLI
jgi:hypothetical protein